MRACPSIWQNVRVFPPRYMKEIDKEQDIAVPEVRVDFPQADERLAAPNYTFRVSTTGSIDAETTELSVDDSPWSACRESLGYWWHDWSGLSAGEHQVKAKVRSKDGRIATSPVRKFTVEF